MPPQAEPTVVEGTPLNTDIVSLVKETLVEESTQAESLEGDLLVENDGQGVDSDKTDLAILLAKCCGFGTSKGVCTICHQSIGISQPCVPLKGEAEAEDKIAHVVCYQAQLTAQEKSKQEQAESAAKIQAVFRGKRVRDARQQKNESTQVLVESNVDENSEEYVSVSQDIAPPVGEKKTFMQKLKGLFSGCRNADAAIIEDFQKVEVETENQPGHAVEEKMDEKDEEVVEEPKIEGTESDVPFDEFAI
jgi:hypothetical protein